MAVGKKVHQFRSYFVYPGRLKNSKDDVSGTWYLVHEDEEDVVTFGRGYETLTAAKEAINRAIGDSPWAYRMLGEEWCAVGAVEEREWSGSEIVVTTNRGEKHVRKVTKVVSKYRIQDNKVLTYVALEPHSKIELKAKARQIATRLDRLLEESESWQKYFSKTHAIACEYLRVQKLDSESEQVLSASVNLLDALENYRLGSVPRKHPSPAWLEETRRLLENTIDADQK